MDQSPREKRRLQLYRPYVSPLGYKRNLQCEELARQSVNENITSPSITTSCSSLNGLSETRLKQVWDSDPMGKTKRLKQAWDSDPMGKKRLKQAWDSDPMGKTKRLKTRHLSTTTHSSFPHNWESENRTLKQSHELSKKRVDQMPNVESLTAKKACSSLQDLTTNVAGTLSMPETSQYLDTPAWQPRMDSLPLGKASSRRLSNTCAHMKDRALFYQQGPSSEKSLGSSSLLKSKLEAGIDKPNVNFTSRPLKERSKAASCHQQSKQKNLSVCRDLKVSEEKAGLLASKVKRAINRMSRESSGESLSASGRSISCVSTMDWRPSCIGQYSLGVIKSSGENSITLKSKFGSLSSPGNSKKVSFADRLVQNQDNLSDPRLCTNIGDRQDSSGQSCQLLIDGPVCQPTTATPNVHVGCVKSILKIPSRIAAQTQSFESELNKQRLIDKCHRQSKARIPTKPQSVNNTELSETKSLEKHVAQRNLFPQASFQNLTSKMNLLEANSVGKSQEETKTDTFLRGSQVPASKDIQSRLADICKIQKNIGLSTKTQSAMIKIPESRLSRECQTQTCQKQVGVVTKSSQTKPSKKAKVMKPRSLVGISETPKNTVNSKSSKRSAVPKYKDTMLADEYSFQADFGTSTGTTHAVPTMTERRLAEKDKMQMKSGASKKETTSNPEGTCLYSTPIQSTLINATEPSHENTRASTIVTERQSCNVCPVKPLVPKLLNPSILPPVLQQLLQNKTVLPRSHSEVPPLSTTSAHTRVPPRCYVVPCANTGNFIVPHNCLDKGTPTTCNNNGRPSEPLDNYGKNLPPTNSGKFKVLPNSNTSKPVAHVYASNLLSGGPIASLATSVANQHFVPARHSMMSQRLMDKPNIDPHEIQFSHLPKAMPGMCSLVARIQPSNCPKPTDGSIDTRKVRSSGTGSMRETFRHINDFMQTEQEANTVREDSQAIGADMQNLETNTDVENLVQREKNQMLNRSVSCINPHVQTGSKRMTQLPCMRVQAPSTMITQMRSGIRTQMPQSMETTMLTSTSMNRAQMLSSTKRQIPITTRNQQASTTRTQIPAGIGTMPASIMCTQMPAATGTQVHVASSRRSQMPFTTLPASSLPTSSRRPQMSIAAGTQTACSMRSQMATPIGTQITSNMRTPMPVITRIHTASIMGAQMPITTGTQISSSMGSHLPTPTTTSMETQMSIATGTQIPSSMGSQLPTPKTTLPTTSMRTQIPSATRTQPVSSIRSQMPTPTTTLPTTSMRTQIPSATRTRPVSSMRSQMPTHTTTLPTTSMRTEIPFATRTRPVSSMRSQMPTPTTTLPTTSMRAQMPSASRTQPVSSMKSQMPTPTTTLPTTSMRTLIPSASTRTQPVSSMRSQMPTPKTTLPTTSMRTPIPFATRTQPVSSMRSQIPTPTTTLPTTSMRSQIPFATRTQSVSSMRSHMPTPTTTLPTTSIWTQMPSASRTVSSMRSQMSTPTTTLPTTSIRAQILSANRTQPVFSMRSQMPMPTATLPTTSMRTQIPFATRTQSVSSTRSQMPTPIATLPTTSTRAQMPSASRTTPVFSMRSQMPTPIATLPTTDMRVQIPSANRTQPVSSMATQIPTRTQPTSSLGTFTCKPATRGNHTASNMRTMMPTSIGSKPASSMTLISSATHPASSRRTGMPVTTGIHPARGKRPQMSVTTGTQPASNKRIQMPTAGTPTAATIMKTQMPIATGTPTAAVMRTQMPIATGTPTAAVMRTQMPIATGTPIGAVMRTQMPIATGTPTAAVMRTQITTATGTPTAAVMRTQMPTATGTKPAASMRTQMPNVTGTLSAYSRRTQIPFAARSQPASNIRSQVPTVTGTQPASSMTAQMTSAIGTQLASKTQPAPCTRTQSTDTGNQPASCTRSQMPSHTGIQPSSMRSQMPTVKGIQPSSVRTQMPSAAGIQPSNMRTQMLSATGIQPSSMRTQMLSATGIQPSNMRTQMLSATGIQPSSMRTQMLSATGIQPSSVRTQMPSAAGIQPSSMRTQMLSATGIQPSSMRTQMLSATGIQPSSVRTQMPSAAGIQPPGMETQMLSATGIQPSTVRTQMPSAAGIQPPSMETQMLSATGIQPSSVRTQMSSAAGIQPSSMRTQMLSATGTQPPGMETQMPTVTGRQLAPALQTLSPEWQRDFFRKQMGESSSVNNCTTAKRRLAFGNPPQTVPSLATDDKALTFIQHQNAPKVDSCQHMQQSSVNNSVRHTTQQIGPVKHTIREHVSRSYRSVTYIPCQNGSIRRVTIEEHTRRSRNIPAPVLSHIEKNLSPFKTPGADQQSLTQRTHTELPGQVVKSNSTDMPYIVSYESNCSPTSSSCNTETSKLAQVKNAMVNSSSDITNEHLYSRQGCTVHSDIHPSTHTGTSNLCGTIQNPAIQHVQAVFQAPAGSRTCSQVKQTLTDISPNTTWRNFVPETPPGLLPVSQCKNSTVHDSPFCPPCDGTLRRSLCKIQGSDSMRTVSSTVPETPTISVQFSQSMKLAKPQSAPSNSPIHIYVSDSDHMEQNSQRTSLNTVQSSFFTVPNQSGKVSSGPSASSKSAWPCIKLEPPSPIQSQKLRPQSSNATRCEYVDLTLMTENDSEKVCYITKDDPDQIDLTQLPPSRVHSTAARDDVEKSSEGFVEKSSVLSSSTAGPPMGSATPLVTVELVARYPHAEPLEHVHEHTSLREGTEQADGDIAHLVPRPSLENDERASKPVSLPDLEPTAIDKMRNTLASIFQSRKCLSKSLQVVPNSTSSKSSTTTRTKMGDKMTDVESILRIKENRTEPSDACDTAVCPSTNLSRSMWDSFPITLLPFCKGSKKLNDTKKEDVVPQTAKSSVTSPANNTQMTIVFVIPETPTTEVDKGSWPEPENDPELDVSGPSTPSTIPACEDRLDNEELNLDDIKNLKDCLSGPDRKTEQSDSIELDEASCATPSTISASEDENDWLEDEDDFPNMESESESYSSMVNLDKAASESPVVKGHDEAVESICVESEPSATPPPDGSQLHSKSSGKIASEESSDPESVQLQGRIGPTNNLLNCSAAHCGHKPDPVVQSSRCGDAGEHATIVFGREHPTVDTALLPVSDPLYILAQVCDQARNRTACRPYGDAEPSARIKVPKMNTKETVEETKTNNVEPRSISPCHSNITNDLERAGGLENGPGEEKTLPKNYFRLLSEAKWFLNPSSSSPAKTKKLCKSKTVHSSPCRTRKSRKLAWLLGQKACCQNMEEFSSTGKSGQNGKHEQKGENETTQPGSGKPVDVLEGANTVQSGSESKLDVTGCVESTCVSGPGTVPKRKRGRPKKNSMSVKPMKASVTDLQISCKTSDTSLPLTDPEHPVSCDTDVVPLKDPEHKSGVTDVVTLKDPEHKDRDTDVPLKDPEHKSGVTDVVTLKDPEHKTCGAHVLLTNPEHKTDPENETCDTDLPLTNPEHQPCDEKSFSHFCPGSTALGQKSTIKTLSLGTLKTHCSSEDGGKIFMVKKRRGRKRKTVNPPDTTVTASETELKHGNVHSYQRPPDKSGEVENNRDEDGNTTDNIETSGAVTKMGCGRKRTRRKGKAVATIPHECTVTTGSEAELQLGICAAELCPSDETIDESCLPAEINDNTPSATVTNDVGISDESLGASKVDCNTVPLDELLRERKRKSTTLPRGRGRKGRKCSEVPTDTCLDNAGEVKLADTENVTPRHSTRKCQITLRRSNRKCPKSACPQTRIDPLLKLPHTASTDGKLSPEVVCVVDCSQRPKLDHHPETDGGRPYKMVSNCKSKKNSTDSKGENAENCDRQVKGRVYPMSKQCKRLRIPLKRIELQAPVSIGSTRKRLLTSSKAEVVTMTKKRNTTITNTTDQNLPDCSLAACEQGSRSTELLRNNPPNGTKDPSHVRSKNRRVSSNTKGRKDWARRRRLNHVLLDDRPRVRVPVPDGRGTKTFTFRVISKPFIRCRFCETFSSRFIMDVNKHVKEVHPFLCYQCCQIFTSREERSAHRKHHQTEIHYCVLCEREFQKLHHYRRHMLSRDHRCLQKVQRNTIHIVRDRLFRLTQGRGEEGRLGWVSSRVIAGPERRQRALEYPGCERTALEEWKQKQNPLLKYFCHENTEIEGLLGEVEEDVRGIGQLVPFLDYDRNQLPQEVIHNSVTTTVTTEDQDGVSSREVIHNTATMVYTDGQPEVIHNHGTTVYTTELQNGCCTAQDNTGTSNTITTSQDIACDNAISLISQDMDRASSANTMSQNIASASKSITTSQNIVRANNARTMSQNIASASNTSVMSQNIASASNTTSQNLDSASNAITIPQVSSAMCSQDIVHTQPLMVSTSIHQTGLTSEDTASTTSQEDDQFIKSLLEMEEEANTSSRIVDPGVSGASSSNPGVSSKPSRPLDLGLSSSIRPFCEVGGWLTGAIDVLQRDRVMSDEEDSPHSTDAAKSSSPGGSTSGSLMNALSDGLHLDKPDLNTPDIGSDADLSLLFKDLPDLWSELEGSDSSLKGANSVEGPDQMDCFSLFLPDMDGDKHFLQL